MLRNIDNHYGRIVATTCTVGGAYELLHTVLWFREAAHDVSYLSFGYLAHNHHCTGALGLQT